DRTICRRFVRRSQIGPFSAKCFKIEREPDYSARRTTQKGWENRNASRNLRGSAVTSGCSAVRAAEYGERCRAIRKSRGTATGPAPAGARLLQEGPSRLVVVADGVRS